MANKETQIQARTRREKEVGFSLGSGDAGGSEWDMGWPTAMSGPLPLGNNPCYQAKTDTWGANYGDLWGDPRELLAPWVNWLRTGPGAAELRERIKTGDRQ